MSLRIASDIAAWAGPGEEITDLDIFCYCGTISVPEVLREEPPMNVSLTKELEKLVNDRVKSGMYQTASEVVREGLRLLKERDNLESLRRDVRAGFAAIDRGEYEEYDENTTKGLATAIKARGRQRLEEFRKKPGAR
jgi:antitoxin ParD1/3/4